MRLFAQFISYLFHPVLFFLIMPFFVVYRNTNSEMYAIKWTLFSSVFILFGVVLSVFETLRGDFTDFDISHKEQRLKFYMILLVIGVTYLLVALFFKGIFFPLSIISFGIALGLIVFGLISSYIKASTHVAVSSAFVITMSVLYRHGTFFEIVWIIALVSWARLILKKHTGKEVITGALLGTLVTILTFLVGNYLYSI